MSHGLLASLGSEQEWGEAVPNAFWPVPGNVQTWGRRGLPAGMANTTVKTSGCRYPMLLPSSGRHVGLQSGSLLRVSEPTPPRCAHCLPLTTPLLLPGEMGAGKVLCVGGNHRGVAIHTVYDKDF